VKPTADIPQIGETELDGVKKVVEGRINGLGVSEPVIQTVGADKILVQLPGVNDPEEAERVLGGTAQLEFRIQKPNTEAQLLPLYAIHKQFKEQQQELVKKQDKAAIAKIKEEIRQNNQAIAALFESTNPPLSGKYLKNAFGSPTQGTRWQVNLSFNEKGGELFAGLTKQLAGTGRSIGIFLDDELISFPTVGLEFAATGITGGSATITGNFDAKQATELGVQLKGGSLPVPVEIAERRTVGATLGQDSVNSSILAGLGGLTLVLLFMALYYRLPGIIAAISLIIYALLNWMIFALLNVTLTLPGIAGFILSIGMAVDANILIFERTREELQAGKSLYRAVESGFYRAFSSILDGNVTTWFAAAALFFLGSGLVKGFAITLALGTAVSMFTAITCSRTFLLLAISIPALRKTEYYCPNLRTTKQVEVGQ
jgi:preprotein translocase subunit SecD